MDVSVITGEAKPVAVMPGDVVLSGSRVYNGELTVAAEQVGAQSLLGQMVEVVTQSLSRKGGLESRSEQLLVWFVPLIVLLALTTGGIAYIWGVPLEQAIIRSVTVLVIACPCALGIAVPLARIAGVSGAGRRGILVKDAVAFENASHLDTIVLDKTGTVTCAQWTVEQIVVAPAQSQNHMIALAMGLETDSDHTIARSLIALGDQMGIDPAPVTDLQIHAQGVSGWFEGRMVRLGSRAFALIDDGDSAGGKSGLAESEGTAYSEVVLSVDGTMGACFFFGDSLRDDMPYAVQQYLKRGFDLHLVSGDDGPATRAVARRLGIANAVGRLLPQNKAEYIRELQNKGHCVAMVGDGVNDAPALAQANLSVAVHGAAPLAQHAAGIALMRGHPLQLIGFLDWATLVERTVRRNLWCALIYNAIAIPVAMTGLLTPLWAVSAMLLSSFTVIGNTLLLIRKDR
jgi:heavy metal translocating P-type ATPase